MKKAKILAVFGILLAMGITACNKGGDEQSQEAPASQEQGGSQEHTHEFGEWHQTVAPTCEGKGKEERECACGEKESRDVKALGHDFGEWTVKTAATCTADGQEERACKRAGCDKKETRVIKAAHDWDAEQAVAAGTDPADQVGYKLAVCKKGDAVKADLKATDAKFYKGKIKSGTPSGYFKLNSTNDKAYWKFTVAGTKMYKGMLYQLGAMDSFSGNTERSYAQTSTSGDHAPKYPLGNFDVVVNGASLDKSQWIDTPYSELLADGEDSSAMGDNYSPICLCPIGEAYIVPGLNEITYERLGSYNLIISDLVFIGSEYEHTHNTASTWSSDDTQHWHACSVPGCPLNGKIDAAAHTFGDWVENKAATCSAKGERQHTCTVCGKVVKEEVEKIAHTYPNDGAYTQTKAPTCTEAGSKERQCSVCEEKDVQVVPALGHNFGEAVDNYAAVTEGENQHIAATAHNCERCDISALRWSALDFDATLSSSTKLVKVDGSATNNAVKTGAAENDGGSGNANPAVSVGNHYVYKVNLPAAVEHAGLAFHIFSRSDDRQVFKAQSNDGKNGNYYDSTTQTFTAAPARYGVRINGQEVYFDEALLAKEEATPKNSLVWRDFPLNDFSLTAGVNTIDVYSMAGYSQAGILEFQVTGLAHVTPSHVHTLGDWQSDDNNHWKVCSGEGCPAGAGAHIQEAAHTFGEVVTKKAATCYAEGVGEKECSICHKKVEVALPKVEHTVTPGTAVKNSDNKDVFPITCSGGELDGYEMALADYSGEGDTADAIASDGKLAKEAVMTWKFKLTADGEGHYKAGKVSFVMCAKLNGGTTGFGSSAKPADTTFADGSDAKVGSYTLSVGSKAGVITAAGKKLGADFGATTDDPVYFEMGTIEFEEADLVGGELVVKLVQPKNQGYRPRFSQNVRIIYLG